MRSAHYRHTFGINLPKINVSVTPCFSYSHVNSESSFGFVDIGVIEAALEKLGIQVSASEVLEAIKDEVVKKNKRTNFGGLISALRPFLLNPLPPPPSTVHR